MGWLKKTKNDIIYYFVRVVIFFLNIIPRSLAVFIGGLMGKLAYWVLGKERQKTISNLEFAFEDKLNHDERKTIAKNVFLNIGRNAVDVMRSKKYFQSEIKHLVDIEGLEHLDAVYNRGRGVIAVSGHIGNFELLVAILGNLGYKIAAIGRELYDKRLNKLLVENREATGLVNIDTRESVRKIFRLLKDGYVLGVLIDTDSMRVRSMFIPAFGKLSWTPVGQSILGLRSGAGFVPIACVREGKRYKIIIRPEVIIKASGDFEKDLYNITKLCTEAWEEIVNEYKDQWIWMHNRWNTKPKRPIN